jgi:hypothetical protein
MTAWCDYSSKGDDDCSGDHNDNNGDHDNNSEEDNNKITIVIENKMMMINIASKLLFIKIF